MADWSQLPKELLHLISERLDSALYLLRFRSVCSSWRSSSSPSATTNHLHHHLPFKFPILSNDATIPHKNNNNASTFSLSKRTLFLITAPQQQQQHQQTLSAPNHALHPWLIKIGQDPRGRTQLWHPLSRFPIKPTPPLGSHFPQVLDLYELPVFDLGHEFVLNDMGSRSFNSLYMEKVVFACLGSQKEGFVLLTIHVSGKLAFFKSGDEGWTIIPDMPAPYDDVCVFKGRLCAVDNTGRTVAVGLDSSVGLVAEPVFGGDKKLLVDCEGELLLVDKYLSSDYLCSLGPLGVFEEGDDDDEIYELGCERAVKFDVFRLEEEEKRWVELTSLGDRVLFLGDDCAFSASVSDLCVGKGDCVIFRDDTFNINALESGMGVFHFDEGRISPLTDDPGFSKLFWPPPDWVRLR